MSPRHVKLLCPPEERRTPFLSEAFTLIEVLVVIAVIGLLCALLLPVLGQAKRKAQVGRCVSNFRQFQTAWLAYEGDHGFLPPNNDQPRAGRSTDYPSWVAGWLRLDNETGDKSDATNTSLLVGPEYEPFGSLGPYTKSAAIYRCALDRSTVRLADGNHPRVRTVSMSAYMNGSGVWQDDNYLTYRRLEDLRHPSESWVFIEEREDSINDGYFAVMMDAQYAIIDTPGNYHDNAAVISFADGHVELHKWLESTTLPPMRPGVHLSGVPIHTSGRDRDMKWLTEHTTARRP